MGRKLGYARVSTHEQSLNMQIDDLIAEGIEERDIFKETVSSRKSHRAELENLLKYAKSGDCIVVWKIDRIARSLKELVNIVNDFDKKGIKFKSLNDDIDLSTANGKFMFHVFSAMAELERDIIKERTLAGLASARKNGRIGGRPTKINADLSKKAKQLQKTELSIEEICESLKVSRATYYKALRATS